MLKIAPETAVKFIAFDALKGAVARDPATATGAERFVAGGAAGAIAQVLCPLDISRWRDVPWLHVPWPYSAHHGPAHSLRHTWRARGHTPHGGGQG